LYGILYTISRGVSRPTHIMYQANLSWKPFKKLLNELVTQGYVTARLSTTERGVIYHLTTRGEQLLKLFQSHEILTANTNPAYHRGT